jgi:cytochrome c
MRHRTASLLEKALVLALAMVGTFAHPSYAQDGNPEEGAEVFKKCRACHDVGPTAKNKVGPLLNGIIGRQAGTIEGFEYSAANREAGGKGLTWSEDVLFKYLENPLTFMPGTKMAFAGLKDPQDRKDLIAYLRSFSNK